MAESNGRWVCFSGARYRSIAAGALLVPYVLHARRRPAANAGSVTLKADVGCWTDDSDSYCTVLRNAPCVATVLVLDARSYNINFLCFNDESGE